MRKSNGKGPTSKQRTAVWRGDLAKTSGGLTKADLTKNKRGEMPIDVVSSPWSKGLADFYTGIGDGTGQKLDLKRIERERPQIAELLRDGAAKSDAR